MQVKSNHITLYFRTKIQLSFVSKSHKLRNTFQAIVEFKNLSLATEYPYFLRVRNLLLNISNELQEKLKI